MASTTSHLPRSALMGEPRIVSLGSFYESRRWEGGPGYEAEGGQRIPVGVIGCTRYLPGARVEWEPLDPHAGNRAVVSCQARIRQPQVGGPPIAVSRLNLPEEAMPPQEYHDPRYPFLRDKAIYA